MKIKSLMVTHPITISPDASVEAALGLMKKSRIRHLPVVTGDRKLEGLLTLADLKEGLIPYMIGDVSLADLMIRKPVTISPEDDIETAARQIYEHKIGGIPVVEGKTLVGIITDSDILRTFIDMMGILSGGSRIEVRIGNAPEDFNRVLKTIQDQGGDIINVSITRQEPDHRVYYFRLSPCNTRKIRKALQSEGFAVPDASD